MTECSGLGGAETNRAATELLSLCRQLGRGSNEDYLVATIFLTISIAIRRRKIRELADHVQRWARGGDNGGD